MKWPKLASIVIGALSLAFVPLAHATFPGKNGRLAISVSSEDGSSSTIYTINPDGSDKKKVASGFDPVFSWDGKKIAYSTGFSGHSNLYMIGRDGEGKKSLGPGSSPSWSPDGKSIVFSTPKFGIAVKNVKTLKDRLLLKGASGLHYRWPQWSPDGTRVVVVKAVGDTIVPTSYISPFGGSLRRLSIPGDIGPSFDPLSWSPDGKQLAFSTFPESLEDAGTIGYMRADGSDAKIFPGAEVGDLFPVWSPDGEKICYSGSEGVYTMNIDGSENELLVEDADSCDWSALPTT